MEMEGDEQTHLQTGEVDAGLEPRRRNEYVFHLHGVAHIDVVKTYTVRRTARDALGTKRGVGGRERGVRKKGPPNTHSKQRREFTCTRLSDSSLALTKLSTTVTSNPASNRHRIVCDPM